nr:hypothetical protein [Tanacetum cinerariifolium]
YALWEVIEFGDSYNVPTNSDPVDSRRNDGRTVTVTTYDIEEKDIKWNMALLSMREDKFWKRTGKKISI